MNAPRPPQSMKRTVGDFINSEQRLADVLALLQRGLNTWEDAPKWLFELSDQIEVNALDLTQSTSPGPDWRELTRRLFVELRNCDQVMGTVKEDGKPVFIQAASVRDVMRDAKAALEVNSSSRGPADTVPRTEFNALLMQEHALSAAYVRLREVIGAMSPPAVSPPEALWSYVEGVARELVSVRANNQTGWSPALFVSPGQLQGLHDGSLPGFKDLSPVAGGYLPVRATPGGKFTLPLYAGQQQASGKVLALRDALESLLATGGAIAEATDAELQAAIDDPQAEEIVKVQAAAVLKARATLAAAKQPEHKAEPREVTDALDACLNACNRVIAQDKGVLGGIDFHALKVGVLRGLAHAQNAEVPAILFDGYAVLQALDARAQARTSPENVSDVLDAIVREMRSGKSEPVRALTSSLKGWSISASDDADGRTWLKIQHPSGAQASISVRTTTGNGDRTIAAQILADLHTDFKAAKAKVGAA